MSKSESLKGKFSQSETKYAVIMKSSDIGEYLYKIYASEETLERGLSKIKDRNIVNKNYRVAKVKVSIEEVENE